MAHIVLAEVDGGSPTSQLAAADAAIRDPAYVAPFVVREWLFRLTEDTDAEVGISFDGRNEHVRLHPTIMPFLRWKSAADRLWVFKVTGTGDVGKVLVMGNDEVV